MELEAERERTLRDFLPQVAPGTSLREGLERVLHARMGALIVLGDGPEVLNICSGGFHFDAEMTPQRLSEVAKMDGAIILDRTSSRIAWANVHLVPDASVLTNETGTRHRTAERVARSIGSLVIAASEEMGTITLFFNQERLQLEAADTLVNRANQLLQVLERFKTRYDEVSATLAASEIEDLVTVREVALVVQRSEMVLRVANIISDLLNSLGERGLLIRLQRDEFIAGVEQEQRFVIEDYLLEPNEASSSDEALGRLAALSTNELLSIDHVATAIAQSSEELDLESTMEPRGVRILRRIPHVSAGTARQLVESFGDLHSLIRAPIDALVGATGMDENEARALKAGMMRFAESSILDRLY